MSSFKLQVGRSYEGHASHHGLAVLGTALRRGRTISNGKPTQGRRWLYRGGSKGGGGSQPDAGGVCVCMLHTGAVSTDVHDSLQGSKDGKWVGAGGEGRVFTMRIGGRCMGGLEWMHGKRRLLNKKTTSVCVRRPCRSRTQSTYGARTTCGWESPDRVGTPMHRTHDRHTNKATTASTSFIKGNETKNSPSALRTADRAPTSHMMYQWWAIIST
jgi:hypothetical protein